MFKKTILLVLFAIGSQMLFAQDAYEAYKRQLAKVACECTEKKDIDSSNKKAFQEAITVCMMEAFMSDPTSLQKHLGDKLSDSKAMEQMGQEIGVLMAEECPATLMQIAIAVTEEEGKEEANETIVTSETTEHTVKVTDVKTGAVSYLLVRNTETSETDKIFILEPFSGSEKVDNISKLKGKTYKITSTERKIYNAQDNVFEKHAVLTGIEL